MKTLTINFINDTKFTRDLDAFCESQGYVSGSKENFVERLLKEHFQAVSRNHRIKKQMDDIVTQINNDQ